MRLEPWSGALLTALALVLPAGAAAVPTIDMSWDQCSPIVSARMPAADPVTTLYVSVTGLAEPHIQYHTRLWFATDTPCRGTTWTPDAWRFDAVGCQGLSFLQVTPNVVNKSCPPVMPPAGFFLYQLTHNEVIEGELPDPIGAMRLTVGATYPAQTPDPAQRYLLYAVRFDHTWSVAGAGTPGVTCGGYETPICLALYAGVEYTHNGQCISILGLATQNFYIPASDNTIAIPFELGARNATFGLPEASSINCFDVVPAKPATWGAIKNQYR